MNVFVAVIRRVPGRRVGYKTSQNVHLVAYRGPCGCASPSISAQAIQPGCSFRNLHSYSVAYGRTFTKYIQTGTTRYVCLPHPISVRLDSVMKSSGIPKDTFTRTLPKRTTKENRNQLLKPQTFLNLPQVLHGPFLS